MSTTRTKRSRSREPEGTQPGELIELAVVDVLADEDSSPRAQLRAVGTRGRRVAVPDLLVPMGIVEGTHLHCLLTGRRIERASWQALYLTSLAASGMEVAAVELESRPNLLTASVFLRPVDGRARKKAPRQARKLGAALAIAAPTDAALLLACEVEAPIYANAETMHAFASSYPHASDRPHERRAIEREPSLRRQAGAALLADLLAHLPDEDFGKWKM